MCGIFAYYSKQNNDAAKVIQQGLKRLEYRGYDSWGIAVSNKHQIYLEKQVGEITTENDLRRLKAANIGIGHTRWATHGGVTKTNAHPHLASDKSFTLAHNGIVENYQQLKEELAGQYTFKTDTDTELLVALIEKYRGKKNDYSKALEKAFQKIEGRNTCILLTKEQEIYARKQGSPLIVASDEQGESIFISSDTLSVANLATKVYVIENAEQLSLSKGILRIHKENIKLGTTPKFKALKISSTKLDKKGNKHFMIKEIGETPKVIEQVISTDPQKLQKLTNMIRRAEQVYTIGSGSTAIAAEQMAYYLRNYAQVNAIPLIGAEASTYLKLFNKKSLIISPSQSGETADVLEILEQAKKQGSKIISYVNMPGSSMERLADLHFSINAGPEICVMATKAFTAKLAWGYLVAKTYAGEYEEAVQNLKALKKAIEGYLGDQQSQKELTALAKILLHNESIYIMAKGQCIAIAKEGMVKIIEGSYIHAHTIPAGDLKHYAITLMEKDVPVIVLIADDQDKAATLNAVYEVSARGADIIAFASEDNDKFKIWLKTPKLKETEAIFQIIPLQLLSYHLAELKGNNVDKPRNIAKSVTVK